MFCFCYFGKIFGGGENISILSLLEVTFVIESQAGVHLGRPGRGVGQVQVDDSPPLLGQLGPGLGVAVVHREVGD